jgi:TonB family protein
MRRVVAFMSVVCLATSFAFAQKASAEADAARKVISRITPGYPELAKRMHLQGSVKVEAVVRPNGVVKSTRVLGGHPVLANAATDAVNKWRFEPGPSETTEVIELTFIPQ